MALQAACAVFMQRVLTNTACLQICIQARQVHVQAEVLGPDITHAERSAEYTYMRQAHLMEVLSQLILGCLW